MLTKTVCPETWAYGLDSESEMTGADGAVLSTVTVTAAEECALPAVSVVTTWRSKSPFSAEVFQLTEYGAEVSVPIAVQAPPPAGRRSKSADATPEPESAESLETETVPERKRRSKAR